MNRPNTQTGSTVIKIKPNNQ